MKKLKETLKHQAQTTCDKCGAPMEYHLNGYLVAIEKRIVAAKADFDEIHELMDKHQCTFEELEKAYKSLSLNASPCEKCHQLEEDNAKIEFDEFISMILDEEPEYFIKNTHDEIWKERYGTEGTYLSVKHFDQELDKAELRAKELVSIQTI